MDEDLSRNKPKEINEHSGVLHYGPVRLPRGDVVVNCHVRSLRVRVQGWRSRTQLGKNTAKTWEIYGRFNSHVFCINRNIFSVLWVLKD